MLLLSSVGCSRDDRRVVVYTSVDQVYSEPVLKDFERESGIRTLVVYDVEAAKTTGLVQRLLTEAAHPRADLFWNNEFVQTMVLDEKKLLAPPERPRELVIRPGLEIADSCWLPLGCRYRVFLVADTIKDPPLNLEGVPAALAGGLRIGMAHPAFGTTATWAAAMRVRYGRQRSREFFSRLAGEGIHIAPGNSVVRDRVVSGELDLGLTDSDDACAALARGASVRLVFPGQEGCGTLEIPGSIALISGSPNPVEARRLMCYLLSRDVEEQLIEAGAFQASARLDGPCSPCLGTTAPKAYSPGLEKIYEALKDSYEDTGEIFLR